jgi:methyl-accepting chemotaxis protein
MLDRFTSYFTGRYESGNEAETAQIRALVLTLSALAAACVPIAAALHGADAIRDVVLVVMALAVGLLFVIKAGRAEAASLATTVILSLLFLAIPFVQRYRGEYELYLIAILQCLVIVVTGLIGRRNWQPLLVMGLCVTAIVVDYAARVMPAGGDSAFPHVSDAITSSSIIVLTTFIEMAIRKRSDRLLAMAESEAGKSAAQVARLEKVIKSSASALGLGQAVNDSAGRTEKIIAELITDLGSVESAMAELEGSSREITESHNVIAEASSAVHDRVADQSAIVTQSSAAVEEMTASIGNISDIAAARRTSISQLKETTESGAREMAKSAESFAAMKSSAESIAEVMSVIRAVASRTNLLAMNAAIEAAHAGEAGKGFSVVADEIRKLSEETSRNVKIINENIKGTIAAVQSATEVNERTRAIFSRVESEADAVASAMEEIGRGLGEISSGSGEILQGVTQSVQIASTVKESSERMQASIASAAQKLEALDASIVDIKSSLGASVGRFGSMKAEISTMSRAGRDNEAGLRELGKALAGAGD